MSTYAFIVGLETYQIQAKPIGSVPFAEADAKAVADALEQLGTSPGRVELILSKQATKASLESRIKACISRLTASDLLIFFFAGHGLSINDQNYLSCHDSQRGDLAATSIRLDWIYNLIRKSPCKQVVLFLDCCHSGLPIDDTMRGIADTMSDDEFAALFGQSQYHVAFAACRPDESSHSSMALSHGIWTYHLLRALRGEEPSALDRGRFVTSHSLQDYLSVEVPRTLRKTIASGAARQTPCVFGNASAQFIVADLKPLLDKRIAAAAAKAVTPSDAAFVGERHGSIKNLSGFKRFHKVPQDVSAATQRFVEGICGEEVKEHANKILSSLRRNLKYGIKDVDPSITGDTATLKTKDFDVNIGITQDEDDSSGYVMRTEVTNFRNPTIVHDDKFNSAVTSFVDTLELQLPSPFNLEDMIANLEGSAIKDSIDIDYDVGLTDVEIGFKKTGVSLRFVGGVCVVSASGDSTPLQLLEAVAKTQAALIASGSTTTQLLNP